MKTKKVLLLVDGRNFVFRHHWTHRTLHTSTGAPTSILYGGLFGLASLMRKFPHADLAFVWDGGGKTWRHRLYPLYKANRKKSADTAVAFQQLPEFERALTMLGIPQFKENGVEADDLIGLICSSMKSVEYSHVIICSGDHDFYQLVNRRISILAREKKAAGLCLLDARAIQRETGVTPREWIYYRALMGDASDNIPSVRRGVGPKTALTMLRNGIQEDNLAPRLSKETRRMYPWLKGEVWKRYRQNVILCRIQRACTSGCVERLPGFLLQYRPFCRQRTQYDEFLTFCADYELAEVLGQRRLLFAKR